MQRVSYYADGIVCVGSVQHHKQLLCVTTAASGDLVVSTAAGLTHAAYFSSELLLPPDVTAVTPSTWSTIEPTMITIRGLRFGVPPADGIIQFRLANDSELDTTCGDNNVTLDCSLMRQAAADGVTTPGYQFSTIQVWHP